MADSPEGIEHRVANAAQMRGRKDGVTITLTRTLTARIATNG